jgi:formylglycine-generating enzyme required for sulfatase activity
LIHFATRPGSVAADGTGSNGLYTSQLLRFIDSPDLPVETMLKRVSAAVTVESKKQQEPWTEGSIVGEFYFKPGAVATTVKPEPATSDAQVEQQGWAAAQSGNTVAGYTAYLQEYPQGRYAAAARIAVASLRAQVAVVQAQPIPQVAPPPSTSLAGGQVIKDCADCPEMVTMPAGNYLMGSFDITHGQPMHPVSVPAFMLGRTEVTQGQWRAVMGSNPSNFKECGMDCPVEGIDWVNAQEYARRLSQKTGKTYRLPSEAEWEYAARAGSSGKWSFGDDESQLGDHAWYGYKGGFGTHAVAQKRSNAFGIFDMHGNVREWVQDVWNENYQGAPNDGSAWLSGGDQVRRVRRGGAWGGAWGDDPPGSLRSANRGRNALDFSVYFTGMRIARTH